MTGHSLVPMSAKAAGIRFGELCLRLTAAATLDADPHRQRQPRPAPLSP
jgi:D-alanine-D-alanine ligase